MGCLDIETKSKKTSPELILKNRLQYSFDKKLKHKGKRGGNILISEPNDFNDQYIDGYESDPELISKKEYEKIKKSKMNNIQTIKYEDNIKEEDENRINKIQMMNNSIETMKDNNKNKENKKKKKKNNLRVKYENQMMELKEKLNQLIKREEELIKKEKKQKELNIEYSNEKTEFKKNQELFNKNKVIKTQELIQREKLLNQKEEKLKIEDDLCNPKIEPILIGLNNIGATCYMNASLQCFSNTKELTTFFLTKYKEKDKKAQLMSHEYHKLIKHLWDEENNKKPYSPTSFKEVLSQENPLFAGIAANDSKDLINFLIERLHNELNVVSENKVDENWNQINQANEKEVLNTFIKEFSSNFNSPISHLFYGILETQSQCKGCNVIKYNFQLYSFLEFPLQQVNQYYYNKGQRPLFTNDGKNPDVDLYECFEYNRKIDLMTGDNQMYCNICNKLCDSTYVNYLYSGPNYLIINLNRGKGAVYECKVIFPEKLNIYNFISYKQGITAYELYAVICHLGPSSMSGHFVAYCRNRIDNKWYLYNDAFVNLCTKPQQYTDGMPYILFYKAAIDGT